MIKLELKSGRSGKNLGYKTITLVNYLTKKQTFEVLTEFGYQLVSKRELLDAIEDYVEVKEENI